jgi:zinc transporter
MSLGDYAPAEDREGPVIFASAISHDGSTRVIGWDHVREWKPTSEEDLLWVHLNRNAEGVRE